MKKTMKASALSATMISCLLATGLVHAQGTSQAGVSDPRFAEGGDPVTTTGDQIIRNMKTFHTTVTSQDDHQNSPISIRERGLSGAGSGATNFAPNLNFHWSGRVSRSLWMDTSGTLNFSEFNSNGTAGALAPLNVAGLRTSSIYNTGGVDINNGSPTIYLRDTDQMSAMIHVNSNQFYILRGCGANQTNWCTYNGRWPLYIDLPTNEAHFGGTLRAPAYLHNSDARLKKDITAISPEDASVKLRQLRPVTYTWKDSGLASMGFIAQDVQEVYPDMVRADKDGMLSVEYAQMIAPMLVTLQQVEQDLADEKEKNVELASTIDALSERLSALEAKME